MNRATWNHWFCAMICVSPVCSQQPTHDADDLAKQPSNPVAALISFVVPLLYPQK